MHPWTLFPRRKRKSCPPDPLVAGMAIEMKGSGRVPAVQLVTDRFPFGQAVGAFEFARSPRPDTCKVMIGL